MLDETFLLTRVLMQDLWICEINLVRSGYNFNLESAVGQISTWCCWFASNIFLYLNGVPETRGHCIKTIPKRFFPRKKCFTFFCKFGAEFKQSCYAQIGKQKPERFLSEPPFCEWIVREILFLQNILFSSSWLLCFWTIFGAL